jgi:hypothetical protein
MKKFIEKICNSKKVNASLLVVTVVSFIAVIPLFPKMLDVTVEFYTEVPAEEIKANLFVMDVDDVQGDHYKAYLCKNWNYAGFPDWMIWQDKPSYCEGGAR